MKIIYKGKRQNPTKWEPGDEIHCTLCGRIMELELADIKEKGYSGLFMRVCPILNCHGVLYKPLKQETPSSQ